MVSRLNVCSSVQPDHDAFYEENDIKQNKLIGRPFVISTQVGHRNNQRSTDTFIDSGANGHSFIDYDYAQTLGIKLQPLKYPRPLDMFDGSESTAGTVRFIAHTRLDILSQGSSTITAHSEAISLFVTKLPTFKVILGRPWLNQHDPHISWSQDAITFSSKHCLDNCLWMRLKDHSQVSQTPQPHTSSIHSQSLLENKPEKTQDPSEPNGTCYRPQDGWYRMPPQQPFTVHAVSAAAFAMISKDKKSRVFAASMKDIDKALAKMDQKPTDPRTKLPSEYYRHLSVFMKQEADKLPPHRCYDHRIHLTEGASPPFGPLYGMSRDELLVLKKYLEDHLRKGFIRSSSSPAASPVMFVRKPGGGLRLCVDYRGLNALTVKNRYPIPLIKETLEQLSKAKIFTKLDIVAAFNRLRIAKGDEWKTAFRTRYGLFEYLVMPFGLANAPSSFQEFINDTLRPFLDRFATAYIDDILIYSRNLQEHKQHVHLVLEKLQEAGLQVDIDKCEFHQTEVKYLGLILTTEGIRMDPEKVSAVVEWQRPSNVKEAQGFLGFANFYRRFIKGYSSVVRPIIKATLKHQEFLWTKECQSAFEELKRLFTSAPILQHFDFDKETRIETDASDGVTAGVLLQRDDATSPWKPVAYLSKKMLPAECNYDIYDKELLAIVRAFEEWRPELEASPVPIEVSSDHKNLVYFMKSKVLNRRQARWSEFLSRFNFVIAYTPGQLNSRADALTRRSGDSPIDRGDGREEQVVLKRRNLAPQLAYHAEMIDQEQQNAMDIRSLRIRMAPATVRRSARLAARAEPGTELGVTQGHSDSDSESHLSQDESQPDQEPDAEDFDDVDAADDNEISNDNVESLQDSLQEAYAHDNETKEIIEALREGRHRLGKFPLSDCTLGTDDRVYYGDLVYAPRHGNLRTKIMNYCHANAVSIHPGRTKMLALVKRYYWWPDILADIRQFTDNCFTCKRVKAPKDRKPGLLRPLPVPQQPWTSLSMDFITDLPASKYHGQRVKNILVVVCRLTKMRHIIPCNKITARSTAQIFLDHVFKLHGLPYNITSDRGSAFVSRFWRHLCRLLDIQVQLSTAYHPETDGQTEITNATLEQMLRCLCDYQQLDWAGHCAAAEFAVNNWHSETTQITPFYANYGSHPRMGHEPSDLHDYDFTANQHTRDADAFAERMYEIHELVREEMAYGQAVYEHYANRRRNPHPNYQVGDRVYLDSRNIVTQRPSKKLDWKMLGPFEILKRVGTHAYQLRLPQTMRIHDVFHAVRLREAHNNPHDGQAQGPAEVEVNASDEPTVEESAYNVQQILGIVPSTQFDDGQPRCIVWWRGYGRDKPTMEPLHLIIYCHEALQHYDSQLRRQGRSLSDFISAEEMLSAYQKAVREGYHPPSASEHQHPIYQRLMRNAERGSSA